jgi:FtsP/CotA-like multicopper oxidase with cupredoxin domain
MTPHEYTDMVTMSQGERSVLEFSYKYPAILEFNYRYSGQYMFHAHKTEFAEKGWTGMFYVKE